MADRFKFAEARQEVIEMLKKDLLGPSSENEILNQNPRFEYIVGMLAPQTSENDSNEQEVDGDASFEGDADYTAGEDDDNEPVFTNRFKTPSSIGISFYLESSTKSFNVDVTWGDYTKASDKTTNKEGKKVDVSTYTRHPQKETVVIDLQEFSKNKEYPLVCDSNVILYISKIGLKQGYTLVTASVLVGQFERDETIIPIKLISMQNPITMLKHRFMQNKGAFQELDKKVLTLRPTIDVLIYGNEVYLFTLNGENLFNMERSYKVLCSDYIAKVQESEIVVNIEKFSSVAGSGHNPRRFVSYNQSHLEKLKNASTRRKIATKFSIPMDGGKFDTNQEGVTEKIVKILCDKGMVDPFESLPMEVPSAKKWE